VVAAEEQTPNHAMQLTTPALRALQRNAERARLKEADSMKAQITGFRVASIVFGLMALGQLVRLAIRPEVLVVGHLMPLWSLELLDFSQSAMARCIHLGRRHQVFLEQHAHLGEFAANRTRH
jgi:hypothetical protein